MKKLINFYNRLSFFQGVALAICLSVGIAYGTVGITTFTSGTVISASTVNANFANLKTAVEAIPFVPTEVGHLTGVTSNIQVQLNNRVNLIVPPPTNPSDAANKDYVDEKTKQVRVSSTFTGLGFFTGTPPVPSNSTHIGSFTGNFATGAYNTFVGSSVGTNTSGFGNTGVGASVLQGLTSGSSNVAVGKNSGTALVTGSNNTLVGYGAGSLLIAGSSNILVGTEAGAALTIGTGNVVLGSLTLNGSPTINDTILIGTGAGVERIRIDDSGRVGIGKTAPSYALDVNGQVSGSGSFISVSDERYKKEIQPVSDGLEKILSLEGVSYLFKTDEYPRMKFSNRRELGLIAQQVEKIFPEAVSKNNEGFRSVAYSMLISPIIEAIKELNSKNTKLEEENKMLKQYLCQKDPEAPFCE